MEQQKDPTDATVIRNVAASFQRTATAHLVDRVRNALATSPSLSTLVGSLLFSSISHDSLKNLPPYLSFSSPLCLYSR